MALLDIRRRLCPERSPFHILSIRFSTALCALSRDLGGNDTTSHSITLFGDFSYRSRYNYQYGGFCVRASVGTWYRYFGKPRTALLMKVASNCLLTKVIYRPGLCGGLMPPSQSQRASTSPS